MGCACYVSCEANGMRLWKMFTISSSCHHCENTWPRDSDIHCLCNITSLWAYRQTEILQGWTNQPNVRGHKAHCIRTALFVRFTSWHRLTLRWENPTFTSSSVQQYGTNTKGSMISPRRKNKTIRHYLIKTAPLPHHKTSQPQISEHPNPGNSSNRELSEPEKKAGKSSQGGFANVDPQKQVH